MSLLSERITESDSFGKAWTSSNSFAESEQEPAGLHWSRQWTAYHNTTVDSSFFFKNDGQIISINEGLWVALEQTAYHNATDKNTKHVTVYVTAQKTIINRSFQKSEQMNYLKRLYCQNVLILLRIQDKL
jgi:hypothetical protein